MAEEQAPASQPTPDRDVFISYASQDAAVANKLVETLERHGLHCWIAPRDVKAGAQYADAIVRALAGAKAFVLVLSEHAIASAHVGREIERAAAKKRAILAWRIDAAPLTPALEYFLGESQWIEAQSGKTEAAYNRLIEAIRNPERSAPTPTATATSSAVHPPSRRKRMALAAGLVIVALTLAVFLAANFRLPKQTLAKPSATAARSTISDKSIAVLPFVDMSERHDQEYFSDGLSEELINMLSKVPDLRVPARTSSFYFKGKQTTIAEIAKALGVAQILEGSVRKSGNNIRVTAQLIHADNGYHVWSETYDRKLDDIFKVQDEIGTAVVKALKTSLLSASARRSATTTGGEAYAVYLQGRSIAENAVSAGATQTGIGYLERAAKLDPTFAPTWATLSRFYIAQYILYGIGSYPKVRDAAYHAAERALQLDPDSAEAHLSMGRVHLLEWNWRGAEHDIGRALALDPASATVARNASYLSIRQGRFDDAVEHTKAATDLDPLNYFNYATLGDAEFYAGKLADAEAAYRKALELRPDGDGLHLGIASVLWERGKFDEALVELEQEPNAEARELGLPLLLDPAGRRSEADRAFALAETKYGKSSPYAIGELYAARNDLDRAFTWWGRAYQAHDDGLSTIKLAPINTKSKQLASDPRYKALLRKLNLPE